MWPQESNVGKIEYLTCLWWNLVTPIKGLEIGSATEQFTFLLYLVIYMQSSHTPLTPPPHPHTHPPHPPSCPPLQWLRMGVIASEIISNSIVCSTGRQQRTHESMASVAGDGKSAGHRCLTKGHKWGLSIPWHHHVWCCLKLDPWCKTGGHSYLPSIQMFTYISSLWKIAVPMEINV